MRKIDYAALAAILRLQISLAVRFNQPETVLALETVARRFAERASVNPAEFLAACGIRR